MIVLFSLACDGSGEDKGPLPSPYEETEAWAERVCERQDECGIRHDGGVDGCIAHRIDYMEEGVCLQEMADLAWCQHYLPCDEVVPGYPGYPCQPEMDRMSDCWGDQF